MKKAVICLSMVSLAMLFIGCVPITYRKTVTTHLDANGKVIDTTITETITEPHSEPARIASPAAGSINLSHIQQ